MRLRTLLVLGTVLLFTVGVATANAGGGNSANAKLCQKGGWQNLHRTDGSTFGNQGACVSYAAHGGKFVSGNSAKGVSQVLCESLGGTYTAANLWTCNGWLNTGADDWNAKIQSLEAACAADGGIALPTGGSIPGASDSDCMGR
jgi:hypothetical protein